jgi:hypothetical protein
MPGDWAAPGPRDAPGSPKRCHPLEPEPEVPRLPGDETPGRAPVEPLPEAPGSPKRRQPLEAVPLEAAPRAAGDAPAPVEGESPALRQPLPAEACAAAPPRATPVAPAKLRCCWAKGTRSTAAGCRRETKLWLLLLRGTLRTWASL